MISVIILQINQLHSRKVGQFGSNRWLKTLGMIFGPKLGAKICYGFNKNFYFLIVNEVMITHMILELRSADAKNCIFKQEFTAIY